MIGVGLGLLAKRRYSGFPFALRSFWQRVRDDGGTMENYNGAISLYRSAPTASLALHAAAYKAGTLYSVLPEDGSGDFTVTRNSVADRDVEGVISSVAVNVPVINIKNSVYSIFIGKADGARAADVITAALADATGEASIVVGVNFAVDTTLHVMGFDVTLKADELRIDYSATAVSVYKNNTLVGTKTGVFDFSGATTTQLGHYEGGSQINQNITKYIQT